MQDDLDFEEEIKESEFNPSPMKDEDKIHGKKDSVTPFNTEK